MIQLEDAKAALRVLNDAEDEYIQSLIDAALNYIQLMTGHWYGEAKTIAEVTTARRVIWLSTEPTAITTIEAYEAGAWSELTTYDVTGRRLTLGDGYRFPSEVRVTYEAGYDDADVPPDAAQRVLQLVALWFENRVPTTEVTNAQYAVVGFSPSI